MGPYRTPVMPSVDPRVTQAINEGLKNREEGFANEKAQLRNWFNNAFFKGIAKRVDEGGSDAVFYVGSTICLRYHLAKDAGEYLMTMIKEVKGLTSQLSMNTNSDWYIHVKW